MSERFTGVCAGAGVEEKPAMSPAALVDAINFLRFMGV